MSDSDDVLVQVLSTFSLLTNIILLLPQIVHNFRRSTTEGLSSSMIVMWLIGTMCPGAYQLYSGQPAVLVASSCLFCFEAVIILCQISYYAPAKVADRSGADRYEVPPPPCPWSTKSNADREASRPIARMERARSSVVILVESLVYTPRRRTFWMHLLLYNILVAGTFAALYFLLVGTGDTTGAWWIPAVVGGAISPVVTAAGFIPQYWLVYKIKSTEGMSPGLAIVDNLGCITSIAAICLHNFDPVAVVPFIVVFMFQSISLILIYFIYPRSAAVRDRSSITVVSTTVKGGNTTPRRISIVQIAEKEKPPKLDTLEEGGAAAGMESPSSPNMSAPLVQMPTHNRTVSSTPKPPRFIDDPLEQTLHRSNRNSPRTPNSPGYTAIGSPTLTASVAFEQPVPSISLVMPIRTH